MIKPVNTPNRVKGFICLTLAAVVLFAAGLLIIWAEQDPRINILADEVQIKGMYGLSVRFDAITALSLHEESMKTLGIGRKANGYGGFGQTLRGYFESAEREKWLLFVASATAPTLHMARDDAEDIYISFRSADKTRALYQSLQTALDASTRR